MDPYGDFQTPAWLAQAAIDQLAAGGPAPRTVVEPTCGRGVFLAAAARRFPEARLLGWERLADHAAAARAAVPGAAVVEADAFDVDWASEAATWAAPIWVVGNPPWVTAAALGRSRGPRREGAGGVGLAAVTGAANFDLAEWVLLRLAAALDGRDARLAVLCKTQSARRSLGRVAAEGLWRIDARRAFGVGADAGWFVARPGPPGWCPVYDRLDATRPVARWRVEGGVVRAESDHEELGGDSVPAWRSGVKHDAASVFELTRDGAGWRNGLGAVVDVEPEALAPLVKAADVYRGSGPERALLLTQRALSDDPAALARAAPRAWAYLVAHADRLGARRSRVWQDRPPFSLFGVGPYTFAPYKVAVATLRAELRFRLVGPRDGAPALLDDTTAFLPFQDEATARDALARLEHPHARAFLAARTFPDALRKISVRALQGLDLRKVPAAG